MLFRSDLALLLEVVASLDRDEVDGSSCTAGQTTLRPNIFTPLMEPHGKRSKEENALWQSN